MNSLPKTVTRQRRGCDLNPGPSALESSMLTTQLMSRRYRDRNRRKESSVVSPGVVEVVSFAGDDLRTVELGEYRA